MKSKRAVISADWSLLTDFFERLRPLHTVGLLPKIQIQVEIEFR